MPVPPVVDYPLCSIFHNGLEHFRSCAVQFIQEEYDGLPVQREPIWRHELGLACFRIPVRNAYEVARVTHLAQEQRDYLHPFAGEVLGEDFGFSYSVISDQHYVLVCGGDVKETQKLRGVYSCVCHVSDIIR